MNFPEISEFAYPLNFAIAQTFYYNDKTKWLSLECICKRSMQNDFDITKTGMCYLK